MKPQDLIVLLKILIWKDKRWSQLELSKAISISPAEVNHALKRLAKAKLYNPETKSVMKRSLLEFILHGVKYAFPAEPGPLKLGLPTAHSAPPLCHELVVDTQDSYVWEDRQGQVRGQSVEPLYYSAPSAAREDPGLHQLLALVDAIRIGRAREVKLAEAQLTERILHP